MSGQATIDKLLPEGTKTLRSVGIETAHLDMLLFLEDVTGHNRAHLLAHPELGLDEAQVATLNTYITQRTKHIPVAYIRGRTAFFGREFMVNPAVLVPRPETEIMIEMLLTSQDSLSEQPSILDIGTGSGCLGITAALEIPASVVWLSDIDEQALQVALQNAQRYGVDIHTCHADLLSGVDKVFEVMLCNLPYVPNEYPINQAASFEPARALFSGSDGLDHYRVLWQQISTKQAKPAHVLTESLSFQHKELEKLAHNAGYTLFDTQDLIQHFTIAN